MKFKLYLLSLAAILLSSPVRSQCSQFITLSSQAEVDSYPANYGCSELGGSLTIQGSDITNLDSLRILKSVRGSLMITSTNITNLDGLSSLTDIYATGPTTNLAITNNALLTSIDGLASLTTFHGIGNTLTISGSPLLTEACSIFLLLRNNLGCTVCGARVNIENNGPGVTYDGIMTGCVTDENRRCDIDFRFTSQAQVDAFKRNYGCSVIEGFVSLNGTSITNVDSLITIEKAEHLSIVQTGLTNVNGLANLSEINGGTFCDGCSEGLTFQSNQMLTNISALSSLSRLDGSLSIADSPLLEDLHGLEGLHSLGGNLQLFNLDTLQSIEALSGLTMIGTNAQQTIRMNIHATALNDLHGLEGITSVAGIVDISGNPKLRNLHGLDNLTSVGYVSSSASGGSLLINQNPVLQSIDGLSSLETIVSELQIWRNPSLKNLDGFRSLKQVGWQNADVADLFITDNDSLENIDGLSNLEKMIATSTDIWPRLNVSENDRLTRFCGLYKIISGNGIVSCESPDCSKITIQNNGVDITGAQIIANGPCNSQQPEEPGQPTNIVFSDVTDSSMTVSFNGNANADGYIAVMRSFESSYPDDIPVDGTQYHVGQVIGYSSIVVSVSQDTVLNIVYLTPDVDYWFDIYSYSYDGTYDYVTTSPLEGMQRTLPEGSSMAAWPNPFVDRVTISFITNTSDNISVQIFDSMGSNVADVVNGGFEAGSHQVVWNGIDNRGNSVPKGVYYYNVKSGAGMVRGRLVK